MARDDSFSNKDVIRNCCVQREESCLSSSHADRFGAMIDIEDTNRTSTASSTTAAASVDFARLCGKLKRTARTGWVYRNVPGVESVADHSWRVAVLCLLLDRSDDDAAQKLDVSKCIEMAVLHDLAEAITGDIAPADGISKDEKHLREEQAIENIALAVARATRTNAFGEIAGIAGVSGGADDDKRAEVIVKTTAASRRMLELLAEYERRETDEAKAVKDLDLLDMIIQADEYERLFPDIDLQEFFDGTKTERFQNDILRDVATEVHRQRTERKKNHMKANGSCADHVNSTGDSMSRSVGPATVFPISSARDGKLTTNDDEFVLDFALSTGMSVDVISEVVQALRAHDCRIAEKTK